jgi:putative tricarboxylic transport membrane protein
MRRAELLFGIAVGLFGLGALIIAFGMRMFAGGIPGPGLFPVMVSSVLTLLGAILAWQNTRARGPEVRAVGRVKPVESRRRHLSTDSGQDNPSPWRSAAVWAGFVAAVPLLYVLGFTLAMMVLIAYLLFIVEGRRTISAVAAVIAIPAVTYVLFVNVLGISLPVGMFRLGVLGI